MSVSDNIKHTNSLECGGLFKSHTTPVRGRTGPIRANPSARVERDDESKTIRIRLDDINNMEFWAELEIPWESLGLCVKETCENNKTSL